MFTIGVFAIILDEKKRVLFCHRTDHNIWNLPGGVLKKGEAPWDGVVREIKEEIGLDVEVEKLVGIYSKLKSDDIVLQFICQVTGGKLVLSNEADEIKYFACADIPHNTVVKQVERVKDFFNNPNKLNMKTQTGKSTRELINEGYFNT